MLSKVGRNDLCPCGSGKKYKKCCLGKETSAVESILRLVTTEDAAALKTAAEDSGVRPAPAEPVLRPDRKLTLPTLKKMVTKEMTWEHPAHEQLAMELIERMRDRYDRELIYEALVLWNGYSRQSKPAVKKSGSFCAAIEYILSETYGFMQSQADLADMYEVTTATISRKVKEMQNYVEEYGLGGEADEMAVVKRSDLSPRQKAQELLYMAAEAAPKRRVQLARTAISLYPDHPDAYLVLAEEAESEQEARAYLKEGITAGQRELGEAYFAENKGHFWLLSETRPYLRVCKSYADSCWFGGDMDEAAKMLEHILEYNPDDNTGARYMLVAVYLHSSNLNAADKLLKKYKDDAAATFAYDRMILEYKKNGLTSQLKMLYRVARGVNKHVPDYLLGVKRLPSNLPDFIGTGDPNEAVEYVITHSRLWASVPELLKWMLKQ